mmetsp:Transcript_6063/g.10783  ORF Transcript_6063/g.10783 Transcript_6063/m.10783 type:complete len:294 (-) Transcript_6063:19-900(-)
MEEYYGDYFDLDEILACEQKVKSRFEVAAWRLSYLDASGMTGTVERNRHEVESESEEDGDDDNGEDESSGSEANQSPDVMKSKLKITRMYNANASPSSSRYTQETNQTQSQQHHLSVEQEIPDIPMGASLEIPFWLASSLANRGYVSVTPSRSYSPRLLSELRSDARSVQLQVQNPYFYEFGRRLAALLQDEILAEALLSAYGSRCWYIVDTASNSNAKDKHSYLLRTMDALEARLFFMTLRCTRASIKWEDRTAHQIPTGIITRRNSVRILGSKRQLAPAVISSTAKRTAIL